MRLARPIAISSRLFYREGEELLASIDLRGNEGLLVKVDGVT